MRKLISSCVVLVLLFAFTACNADISRQNSAPLSVLEEKNESEEQTMNTDKKETHILVVYFYCTGTTEKLAKYAAGILGADLFEIVPEDPYTEEDLAYYTGGRADREQNDPDVRPVISGNIENLDRYDSILIGYPIWHGQAPRIISTFLESYDFSGKTILPLILISFFILQ